MTVTDATLRHIDFSRILFFDFTLKFSGKSYASILNRDRSLLRL